MKKIAVITGANSGFGLLATLEFAKEGYEVVAAMRDINKCSLLMEKAKEQGIAEYITIFSLEITSANDIKKLQEHMQKKGRIDVLINNAGFAGAGFAEEISIEEYKNQFETNLFGTIAVTQNLLPIMRRQGFGKIILMSSISGKVGFPGLSPYVSSKFALEGWSESLRLELLPFSIYVSLVEPGSYQTNIWSTGKKISERSQLETSPYYQYMNSIEGYLEKNRENYGNPIEVAKRIVQIAKEKKPRLRYVIGKGVKQTILIKHLLPWKWWERLVFCLLRNR
ncbi:oxidoreductase [Niallia sp. NCCP-28]|uniref:oxidoreductase n=1 Tax=Niallia sp. NCCP-28 TaxID=2934712 RepID=UPI0020899750|nr:oxidoreductase [Niallia sp. NCCP-28]GKU81632.1 short-chain dehydrogenase/reductase [Niallia sp. NCCP-28]